MQPARMIWACGIALLVASGAGCVRPSSSVAVPESGEIDLRARPAYWLEQPGSVHVSGADYERLLAECEHTLRQRRFEIDRVDYRGGIVSSLPLISKQTWEFWRSDVVDWPALQASSLATHRRSVHWELTRGEAGAFSATPKVVIERFTAPARRITSVLSYRNTLSEAETETRLTPGNIRQVGEGNWYAVGRDSALEQTLADDLRQRLD